MVQLKALPRQLLKRPKAYVRGWFDKAATPLRSELHILVARLCRDLQRLEANDRAHLATLTGLQNDLEGLRRAVADHGAAIAQSTTRGDILAQGLRDATTAVERLSAITDDHGRQLSVRTMNDWVHHLDVATTPLVSIIMPTRDRAELVGRAVASALAQSYANWELVIVDDGSVDTTPEVLKSLSDPRIRTLRGEGRGCCAARNIALRDARGTIVTYLDDDNVMHPDWLKAVVWGFEQRPASEVLYGAFVVDDTERVLPDRPTGSLPRLYWHRYDHHAVAHNNVADIGAIAHRAGLPEAHFDESLIEMGDWDLLLRLTRQVPPFVLPAVACFYTTDAPHRLSGGPSFAADYNAVCAKNRRTA